MRACLLVVVLYYTTLSAQPPVGYYTSAASTNCASLKTALSNIITNGHNPQTYGALWTQYLSSDITPRPASSSGSANVIWDMYSFKANGTADYYFTPGTNQCGNYNSEGDCYNREHSFPASWFNDENPAYTDYNHLFPTDGWVNNKRSNFRFGEVASASYTSSNGSKLGSSAVAGISGTVFEPINEYKGDFARAYLYMVTRYQSRISTWIGYNTDGALTFANNTFPSVEINYLRLMLKWHNQDPVSAKEIARNNACYSFQGNRNPFIDSPQYVNQVWNNSCPGLAALPVNIIAFTGKLNNGNVLLNWETASEINFSHYEVERSFNGTHYFTIANITATGKNQYSFTDVGENLRGRRVYYRLKKVDKDGTFTFSEVFTLHIPNNIKFTIYPNPAKDFITIQQNGLVSQQVQLQITDLAGKTFIQGIYGNNAKLHISVQHLTEGTYLIKITSGNETFIQKFIKTK
jgi:endonuclease I